MDRKKVDELTEQVVRDVGGTFITAQAYIGDRLGLFAAMDGAGMLSSQQLAEKTGMNERYIREWARAMVAAAYIEEDRDSGRFYMTEEQALVLAREDGPTFMSGLFQFAPANLEHLPQLVEAFRSGGGIDFDEMSAEIPEAIERTLAPGYKHFLVRDWIGAVPGLTDKLKAGGSVADVGCGCGQSTVHMARAFPLSSFLGIEPSAPSLKRARALASQCGVTNVSWLEASVEELSPGAGFDLVCSFDCIHDMTDPCGALRAIRASMAPDGVYLWSEANASHVASDNRNPIGKLYAGISPIHCMTVSLACGGEGLGTIMGERGARNLAEQAGFTGFEKLDIANPFTQFFLLRR